MRYKGTLMEELPFLTPKAKTMEGKGLLPAWDVDVMSGDTAASSLAGRCGSQNHARGHSLQTSCSVPYRRNINSYMFKSLLVRFSDLQLNSFLTDLRRASPDPVPTEAESPTFSLSGGHTASALGRSGK